MFNSQQNSQEDDNQNQTIPCQTQHLLSQFPIQIPPQLQPLQTTPQKKTQIMKEVIGKKIRQIIKHLLERTRSKKECFDVIKNCHFLYQSYGKNEGQNGKKGKNGVDIGKKIAKIKVVKNQVDKEVLEGMCFGVVCEVVLGVDEL